MEGICYPLFIFDYRKAIKMKQDEKRPDVEIAKKSKFLLWLDNYWYHYKWHTIIVAFILVVIIVCSWQMFTTDKYDILIVYGGPNTYSQDEKLNISNVLGNSLPSDFDGDGKKNVALTTYQIYSEEQIKEIESKGGDVNRSYVTSQKETYDNQNLTGSTSICFLDPSLYEAIPEKDKHLCPLNSSHLFGEDVKVKGAIDGYGVRLGDTDIYKDHVALQKMPADTIICLWNPLGVENLFGKTDEAANQFEREAFVAIVGYESVKG